jgi:hypothetical protein
VSRDAACCAPRAVAHGFSRYATLRAGRRRPDSAGRTSRADKGAASKGCDAWRRQARLSLKKAIVASKLRQR